MPIQLRQKKKSLPDTQLEKAVTDAYGRFLEAKKYFFWNAIIPYADVLSLM